jgi:thioredoxin 1
MMFGGIEEIGAMEWKERVLASKRLVVVEFWHQGCPHCRAVAPVYDELALEYGDKLKFARLDVLASSENQQLAAKHGIMGTPTFLFFCGGRPVNGVVGALPKEDLAKAIEFTIQKHKDCTKKSTPLKLPYIS